jgi:hypothetical protein
MNFLEAVKLAQEGKKIRNKNWNYDESIGIDKYSKLMGIDYEELIGNQWELFDEEDK